MKWMLWLGKLMLGTILVSVLSVYTAWYAINGYVQHVFQQMNIGFIEKPLDTADFLSHLAAQFGKMSRYDQNRSDAGEADKMNEPAASEDGINGNPYTSKYGPYSEEAIAAWSEMNRISGGQSNRAQEMVLTAEDFIRKKDSLTDEDKIRIFSLLAGSLPQEQLQIISEYVEDGITAEEMQAAQEIVEKYLRDDEFRELLSILDKY